MSVFKNAYLSLFLKKINISKQKRIDLIRKIRNVLHILWLLAVVLIIFVFAFWVASYAEGILTKTIIVFSIILFFQGIFAVILLVYTWNNPLKYFKNTRHLPYEKPFYSFTAMIPAHHEEEVIAKTIKSIDAIDYPEDKKQIFILINRKGNAPTINEAKKVIAKLKKKNIELVVFGGKPGKSEGLNIGLNKSTKDIVTIFDAEDRVHPDLFKAVNTIFVREGADVVQSGVQLMTFEKDWYSLFNVLEYYFWFKSSLHFFAKSNAVPLGGNTVFFRRYLMQKIGGWDTNCLTEDADVGIRLSTLGINTSIFYDEELATREQTPPTIASFIKQRTRWNQGFMQIFFKGDWMGLQSFKQKFFMLYVLLWPFMQAVLFFFIPIFFVASFFIKMPLALSLVSFLPLYILFIFGVFSNLAIYDFTKKYNRKYSLWLIPKIFLMIIPFQILLGISALRAMYRQMFGQLNWEKTEHLKINDNLEH